MTLDRKYSTSDAANLVERAAAREGDEGAWFGLGPRLVQLSAALGVSRSLLELVSRDSVAAPQGDQDLAGASAVASRTCLSSKVIVMEHPKYFVLTVGKPAFALPLLSRFLPWAVPTVLLIGLMVSWGIPKDAAHWPGPIAVAMFVLFLLREGGKLLGAMLREFVWVAGEGKVHSAISDPLYGRVRKVVGVEEANLAVDHVLGPEGGGGFDIFPLYQLLWPGLSSEQDYSKAVMGHSHESLRRAVELWNVWKTARLAARLTGESKGGGA